MRDTRNGLKDTTMVRDGRSKAFSSSMKRIFGESVKATSINGMFHELPLKFSLYNILINC